MGNLWQENRFNTLGDGIAQWLNSRKDKLLTLDNYISLEVQLNYIIWELNNTETVANNKLKETSSIDESTIVFQNYYERCNKLYCMQENRIQYAKNFYNINN